MSENKKETKNQDMIEKEMKEKMKQTVEDEKIPSSLEPEAVEKMLETRKKKKSNNRRWKYASVAAAACVCLVVGAVGYTNMNAGKNERPGTVTEGRSEEDQGKIALAKNYDEIKKYLKENEKRAEIRSPVSISHLDNIVRCRFLHFILKLFNFRIRNGSHFFAGF